MEKWWTSHNGKRLNSSLGRRPLQCSNLPFRIGKKAVKSISIMPSNAVRSRVTRSGSIGTRHHPLAA
jgi:hypothetical protein